MRRQSPANPALEFRAARQSLREALRLVAKADQTRSPEALRSAAYEGWSAINYAVAGLLCRIGRPPVDRHPVTLDRALEEEQRSNPILAKARITQEQSGIRLLLLGYGFRAVRFSPKLLKRHLIRSKRFIRTCRSLPIGRHPNREGRKPQVASEDG